MTYSILDNDWYKFLMLDAVVHLHPEKHVGYKFYDRKLLKYTPNFYDELLRRFEAWKKDMSQATHDDLAYLEYHGVSVKTCDFLANLDMMKNKNHIFFRLMSNGQLKIDYQGNWAESILLEVPLLAMISETYYDTMTKCPPTHVRNKAVRKKARVLAKAGCKFMEFGTRRRRSYGEQRHVAINLMDRKGFLGTSNVALSQEMGTDPMGTVAHEWIMAYGAMHGYRDANRLAQRDWLKHWRGRNNVALADTYTSDNCFDLFDRSYLHLRLHDWVRQDSGHTYSFARKYYDLLRVNDVDPSTKGVIFSDGLTPQKAVDIQQFCNKYCPGMKTMYGIGTNFTNDFKGYDPLNIVIKLDFIEEDYCVKLSDDAGKWTGNAEVVRRAQEELGIE